MDTHPKLVTGLSGDDVLSILQYHPKSMAREVKKLIDANIASGGMRWWEEIKWTDFYEDCLKGYTYLKTS